MSKPQLRQYCRKEVVTFRKTAEAFGGLSNMAPGFPIKIRDRHIRTSEALYQACRFPHLPDIQLMILNELSPMTAKMRSKPFREQSRPDWDQVRVPIMKWCLRTKLASNWSRFSSLLIETGDKVIVEDSRKDDFWGAKASSDDTLTGQNILGRLLTDLREKLKSDSASLRLVKPVPIPEFALLGELIGEIEAPNDDQPLQAVVDAQDRQLTFL